MNAPIISEIFKRVSKKHVNNLKQIPAKAKKALLEEKRACRDECVGKIGYRVGERTGFLGVGREDSEDEVFSVRDEVLKFLCSKEATEPGYRVILVLESPHVNEYQGTPGPAKGVTGQRIKENLVGVLLGRDLLEPGREYALILMNAVQHQCSLGVPTEHHRDAVFRAMWDEESVVTHFARRLESYGGANGAIIVNACTRGDDTTAGEGSNGGDALKDKELRRLVEGSIRRVRSAGSHLKVSHPSGWRISYWDSTS